jgi:ankyrin repeat protein
MLIHDYTKDGYLSGVADELARDVDIEARDEHCDYTPLMFAVTSEKAGRDMVQFLLEKGANLNAVREAKEFQWQENVLYLAVKNGSCEKISLLLDAGADIRYELRKGYDVLIDAMHRQNIARDSDLIPIIGLLINRGAKLNGESEYGESALSVASNNGRFDAMKVLLDAGSDPKPLGWTPLMHAIALGTLRDVQLHLNQGSELVTRDCWNRSPWLLSLQVGDVAKSKLLLATVANTEDRGRCGKVPLMYPLYNGHVAMLRWLLSEGFNPDDTDEFQTTALMEAAEVGAAECMKVLIEAGANIHLENHIEHKAITMASNLDVVRLLVSGGADLNDINDDMRAVLTKLPNDKRIFVSREEYLATKNRRFGKSNPEKMNFPFWKSMVTSGVNAWFAKDQFDDNKELKRDEIFCFQRFGKSINEIPDGRIIEIAGEHEDHYDPNFCIYNDVIVHYGDGTFDILGYPKEVFPPTDFHTATLVGKYIYIIGSLGYYGERRYGITQVYRLNIETLAIEEVQTSGDNPGWINSHKATFRGNHDIHIHGGKICIWNAGEEEYVDNPSEYILKLDTLVWHKVAKRS